MPAKKAPAKRPATKATRTKSTKATPGPKKAATRPMGMSSRAPLKPAANGIVYLSGGNPQIPMGDGDAPVQAYLRALLDWKAPITKEMDAIITRSIPGVRKAVKWNSPMYGVAGQGFFLSLHMYTNFVRVSFFKGAGLRPLPPVESKQKDVRYLDVHEDGFDSKQFTTWVKQAAAIPGWSP